MDTPTIRDASAIGPYFVTLDDGCKKYANVSGIRVLHLKDCVKSRSKKPPSCTLTLTDVGCMTLKDCALGLETCELAAVKRFFHTQPRVLNKKNTGPILPEHMDETTLSVPQTQGGDMLDGLTTRRRGLLCSSSAVYHHAEIPQPSHSPEPPHVCKASTKNCDSAEKAKNFQRLVNRLLESDKQKGAETRITQPQDPGRFIESGTPCVDMARPGRKDSSASDNSHLGVTSNASHRSESTTASSVSAHDGINMENSRAQNKDDAGKTRPTAQEKTQNKFNPSAADFNPLANGFNPNAAAFAPTSAIPMSDAAVQAVEQQKQHQHEHHQQQPSFVMLNPYLAQQSQLAVERPFEGIDLFSNQQIAFRRQPLSNISPELMTTPTEPSNESLSKALAAQQIAFLAQQSAAMAAAIGQHHQSYAASLGAAHGRLAALALPPHVPFSTLPNPATTPLIPPVGLNSSVPNGMPAAPCYSPQFPAIHGLPYSESIQTPQCLPPSAPRVLANNMTNIHPQKSASLRNHIPVNQRSLVSLAGMAPASQTLANSMPLTNQHLLKFDCNGNLIDVPKPRDHGNPQLQMAYEAAIEWKKANVPGYAQSCRERQNNRFANKYCGRQQLHGPGRGSYV